ncbi:MAG TPA: hypothetical protein VHJ78_07040 [Actinomycetota bacterium]|nr:hypothetical protein [Actinomycetota bacterium]
MSQNARRAKPVGMTPTAGWVMPLTLADSASAVFRERDRSTDRAALTNGAASTG